VGSETEVAAAESVGPAEGVVLAGAVEADAAVAVARATDRTVGSGVGGAVGGAVGIGVGTVVGVGVGLAVGLALGHRLSGTLRPVVGWTAAPYETPTSAAGIWLVTKGVSPDPTPAKPPSAP
jgi:hypothetical protein